MLRSQAKWKFTDQQVAQTKIDFDELKLSPLIERLLIKRGIQTNDEAIAFMQPKLTDLSDPALLSDIEKAKHRIDRAIKNQESILVFGDYDADGVSSTALLVETLRELGAMCDYYIPNRFTEGYGPNVAAFEEAARQGFQLIITVDTGIAAFEPAKVAKELGIDLIITDHHEIQATLPEAYAIVHPKCSDKYSFKELAGVGVAFQFAHYLLGYLPKQFLDLVAIGTIADLVPLVHENRILAFHGLQALSQSKRPGIQALKKIAGLANTISEEDVGFLIGPRINAVGRLQSAYPALELLLTEDSTIANEIATEINQINQQRQEIVLEIAEEATQQVEENPEANEQVIVVAKEGWNQGVLGIVASKLVRTYQRPAIVLTLQPDQQSAKGSARSIPAFDMFENGMEIYHLFSQFGGHAQAAGMTVPIANISQLRYELNQLAKEKLAADDFREELVIEETISIEDINLELIESLQRLAPYGMGNAKPLFHVRAKPMELRQIGSKHNHLKLTFESRSANVQAVGFGIGHLYHYLSPQAEVDVVSFLQINEWNGTKHPQMMIQDLAVSEWQLLDYRGSKFWQKQVAGFEPSTTAIVTFQENQHHVGLPFTHVTFDELLQPNYSFLLKDLETIIITDLPKQREDMKTLIKACRPDRIVASYQVSENQLSRAFPSHDEFRWFYAMMRKRTQFHLGSDLPLLMKHKGWKKDKIEFMICVFSELEFVKITNGVVRPLPTPKKRDLTESVTYQQMLEQTQVEELLYYSSYQTLKQWLGSQMEEQRSVKEEMIDGL